MGLIGVLHMLVVARPHKVGIVRGQDRLVLEVLEVYLG